MTFKKWLMKKYNLLPAEQLEEIQCRFEKDLHRYRELIKEMSPQVTVSHEPIVELMSEFVITDNDLELLSYDYMIDFAKRKISEDIADSLMQEDLIKFEVDREYYKATTGSILVKGTIKVGKQ